MENKAVQVSVYLTKDQKATENNRKRSWLFGRDNRSDAESSEKDPPDTLAGKASIGFQQLLSRNCVTGDFPLIMNTKESGGTVRLALYTAAPINPDQYTGITDGAQIKSKGYDDELVFNFKE
jgi:hypothetical protein